VWTAGRKRAAANLAAGRAVDRVTRPPFDIRSQTKIAKARRRPSKLAPDIMQTGP